MGLMGPLSPIGFHWSHWLPEVLVGFPPRGSNSVNESETSAVEQVVAGTPSPEFVQLFTQYQRRLFLYILSQVPNPIEAEEVQQETNVVIWSKFAQFRSGTNFPAWVSQIANFEVMKYRTRKKREKLHFSDEFLQTVAEASLQRSEELETRRAALFDCLKRLRAKDRELIEQRYAPGERGKHLAEQIGRPANSVYQSLGRIRRALLDCVEKQLTAEAIP